MVLMLGGHNLLKMSLKAGSACPLSPGDRRGTTKRCGMAVQIYKGSG